MFHSVFLDIPSISCGLYRDDNSGISFEISYEYLIDIDKLWCRLQSTLTNEIRITFFLRRKDGDVPLGLFGHS